MTHGRGFYLTLSVEDVRRADEVGYRRRAAALAVGRRNARGYKIDGAEALESDKRAARAELAASRWLAPVKWNALLEKVKDSADLVSQNGILIDVKCVGRYTHRLLVPCDPLRHLDVAYLLVGDQEYPDYWMGGWVWGRDVTDEMIRELQLGRPAYVVPHQALKSIMKLEFLLKA